MVVLILVIFSVFACLCGQVWCLGFLRSQREMDNAAVDLNIARDDFVADPSVH